MQFVSPVEVNIPTSLGVVVSFDCRRGGFFPKAMDAQAEAWILIISWKASRYALVSRRSLGFKLLNGVFKNQTVPGERAYSLSAQCWYRSAQWCRQVTFSRHFSRSLLYFPRGLSGSVPSPCRAACFSSLIVVADVGVHGFRITSVACCERAAKAHTDPARWSRRQWK